MSKRRVSKKTTKGKTTKRRQRGGNPMRKYDFICNYLNMPNIVKEKKLDKKFYAIFYKKSDEHENPSHLGILKIILIFTKPTTKEDIRELVYAAQVENNELNEPNNKAQIEQYFGLMSAAINNPSTPKLDKATNVTPIPDVIINRLNFNLLPDNFTTKSGNQVLEA
jgi:hypothetical protein